MLHVIHVINYIPWNYRQNISLSKFASIIFYIFEHAQPDCSHCSQGWNAKLIAFTFWWHQKKSYENSVLLMLNFILGFTIKEDCFFKKKTMCLMNKRRLLSLFLQMKEQCKGDTVGTFLLCTVEYTLY